MVSCPSLVGNRNFVEARPLHRWTPRGDAQGRRQPLLCRGGPPVFNGRGGLSPPGFPPERETDGGKGHLEADHAALMLRPSVPVPIPVAAPTPSAPSPRVVSGYRSWPG